MKNLLLFLSVVSLVSLVNLSNAQNIDPCLNYDWVNNSGGGDHDLSEDVAPDEFGNAYVVGRFKGTATFGSQTLSSVGQADVFVGKMDSLGQWLWVKQVKGADGLDGKSIKLDNQGNLYISGSIYGEAIFGNDTIFNSKIYANVFVAKLDTSGNWLWIREAGGNSHDYCYGMDVDLSGNVYITGRVGSLGQFGATTVGTQGDVNMFMAKLDASGNWIWATSSENATQGTGKRIFAEKTGNVYLIGLYQQQIDFGAIHLVSNGNYDAVIAKIDSTGNWLWAKSFGGNNYDALEAITEDANGNLYVGGLFSGSATFGANTFNSAGITDIFLSKLNSSGNFIWTKTAGGSAADVLLDLTTNAQGDVFATGHFSETASFGSQQAISEGLFDIFISKVDASGNWIWTKTAGSDLADDGRSVAVDIHGNLYVAGYFQGGLSFGQHALSSNGGYDVFTLRMTGKIMDLSPMAPLVTGCGTMITMPAQASNYSSALWTPSTGLSDPTLLNPGAKLLQTTEFTLTVADACGQTLSEKVEIGVTPLLIDAGPDATISQGSSVQLTATLSQFVFGTTFLWTPGTGLNDSTIKDPMASPQTTTTYIASATTPFGCTNSDTITITITKPNGLANEEGLGVFRVYPNPANNFVYVSWQSNTSEPVHCEIINQQGQVIQNQVFESGKAGSVNLKDIQSGFYWIRLTQGSTSGIYKLVKTQ